jgi:hypothetical protein
VTVETDPNDQVTIFYRIIRGTLPTVEDFTSARDLGKPLRDPTMYRQWAFGISVYDSLDHAIARALFYRLKLGQHIAAIAVPREAGIAFEQTGSDLHHFTLYSDATALLSLVRGPIISVEEEVQT